MIQMGTILDVADNTGAKKIACITVLGGSTGQYGNLGDVISASVKEAAPDGTVKKGAKVLTGGKAPGEIALSVVAEVVAVSHGRDGGPMKAH